VSLSDSYTKKFTTFEGLGADSLKLIDGSYL